MTRWGRCRLIFLPVLVPGRSLVSDAQKLAAFFEKRRAGAHVQVVKSIAKEGNSRQECFPA
jgi:hypothetical protein